MGVWRARDYSVLDRTSVSCRGSIDRSVGRSIELRRGRFVTVRGDWRRTYGDNDARRITRRVCRRGERQINVTPSPFEQSFAQWPRTGDTGLVDCAERGSMMVCEGWRQRRKGLDCTGYITRHSWLSPMRFNARSRTSITIPGKMLSPEFCRLSFCASNALHVRRCARRSSGFSSFISSSVHHSSSLAPRWYVYPCLSKVRGRVDRLIYNCDRSIIHLDSVFGSVCDWGGLKIEIKMLCNDLCISDLCKMFFFFALSHYTSINWQM